MRKLLCLSTVLLVCFAFLGATWVLPGKGQHGGTSTILTNLKGFWTLDEASGSRADSSGNGYTLTDNNTVASATGKISNGADFEFSNSESLTRADNADLSAGNTDFCIWGWVKWEDETNYQTIVSKHDNSTNAGSEYLVMYRPDIDDIQFAVYSGGSAITVDSGLNLNVSTWYFFIAWHDATADTINIQIDANTVASTATGGSAPNDGTAAFSIGSTNNLGNWMDGIVDEVGFRKQVPTSGERTELYNSGNGKTYPFN